MNHQTPTNSSIEVTVAHNPLAFFYMALTPSITINGKRERRPWGTHTFHLPPGEYEVAASYPWIVSECGKNSVNFSLKAGEIKKVRYCARLIRFWPGSISVETATALVHPALPPQI